MNLISFLDLLSVVFLLIALAAVLKGPLRKWSISPPLLLLILFFALNSVPNFFEWLGYEEIVEPFEEFIQVLLPVAFFSFFSFASYSARQEEGHPRNRIMKVLQGLGIERETEAGPGEKMRLLHRIIEGLGVTGGWIALAGRKGVEILDVPWPGGERFREEVQDLDIRTTFPGRILTTREVLVVDNTGDVQDPLLQVLHRNGIRSAAFFPMVYGDEVLGFAGVLSGPFRIFSPEETELLGMLGHRLGEMIGSRIQPS